MSYYISTKYKFKDHLRSDSSVSTSSLTPLIVATPPPSEGGIPGFLKQLAEPNTTMAKPNMNDAYAKTNSSSTSPDKKFIVVSLQILFILSRFSLNSCESDKDTIPDEDGSDVDEELRSFRAKRRNKRNPNPRRKKGSHCEDRYAEAMDEVLPNVEVRRCLDTSSPIGIRTGKERRGENNVGDVLEQVLK
ncbi:hypothetical protein HAX54_015816 [Datura stramonium]|uniref:Uncharacterized protein n=1 Tax=Datura stramonium TaxID=4076 RepID=A0ABS8UHS9_DATST|nr:hypothetical protein [Datura stramonium]